jgi:hypothetical protein
LPFQTMSNLTSHREQSVPRVWYETQNIFHFKKERKRSWEFEGKQFKSSKTVKPVLSFWFFDWTIFLFLRIKKWIIIIMITSSFVCLFF